MDSRTLPGLSPDTITVVIADDHPMFRAGLRAVIDREEDIRILEEAGDGRDALAAIERHIPRVAVLDIEMPLLSGLKVVQEMTRLKLPTAPIILTMYDDRDIFEIEPMQIAQTQVVMTIIGGQIVFEG